jgi:hypothetical protein
MFWIGTSGQIHDSATHRCRGQTQRWVAVMLQMSGKNTLAGRPIRSGPERYASRVELVSLLLGSVCLIAPTMTARAFGLNRNPSILRTIGVVDLAVGLGLRYGRSKSSWLLARAASNPLIAALIVRNARAPHAHVVAAALLGATLIDLRVAARLRDPRRPPSSLC